jgi:hypothetical protein
VKTEIMEKIPIVIPKSERKVLNLLTATELMAKRKLSFNILKNILKSLHKNQRTKDKKNHRAGAQNFLYWMVAYNHILNLLGITKKYIFLIAEKTCNPFKKIRQ